MSTVSPIGNEAVLPRETLPATGLLGMELVRLGLERSKTAREATEIIGALIERYGQGGCGNTKRFPLLRRIHHRRLCRGLRAGKLGPPMDRAPRSKSCVHLESILRSTSAISARPTSQSHARERDGADGESSLQLRHRIFEPQRGQRQERSTDGARTPRRAAGELVARNGRRTIREILAILRDHDGRGEMPPAGEPAARDESPTLCMHGSRRGTTASMIAELPAPEADTDPRDVGVARRALHLDRVPIVRERRDSADTRRGR